MVLDDSSSTGQKLTEWYSEHNIQLYDQEGQLRSLYSIVGDVANIWDTLTDNEQKYYLQIQGSATQTQNLSALISNYGTAVEATAVALDSAGSAAEENSRYMTGLQSSVDLLSATFEDFSNNVLNKDLLKALLNVAQGGLELLNTGLGTALTRATLFGGTALGLVGILGQIGSKIGEVIASMSKAISAGTALSSGGWALIIGGVVAALTLLVNGISALIDVYHDANPTFEEAQQNLEATQTEIETTTQNITDYTTKLKELNEVGIGERTEEWAAERAELELNLSSAQTYLEILKQLEKDQAEQLYKSGRATGYSAWGAFETPTEVYDASGQSTTAAYSLEGFALSASQISALTSTYTTQYEALAKIVIALHDVEEGQYQYISDAQYAKLATADETEQIQLMTKWLNQLGIYLDEEIETTEEAFDSMDALAKTSGGLLTTAEQNTAIAYLQNYKQLVDLGIATADQIESYNALRSVMEKLGYTFDDVNGTITDAEGNVEEYADTLGDVEAAAEKATTAIQKLRGEMDVGEAGEDVVSAYESFVEAYEQGERKGSDIEGGLALMSESFKAAFGYDPEQIEEAMYNLSDYGYSWASKLLWGNETPEDLIEDLTGFFQDAAERGYVSLDEDTGILTLNTSLAEMGEEYGFSAEAMSGFFDLWDLYSPYWVDMDADFATLAATLQDDLGKGFGVAESSAENAALLFQTMADKTDLTGTEMKTLYQWMVEHELSPQFDEEAVNDAIEAVNTVEDEYTDIDGQNLEAEAVLHDEQALVEAEKVKKAYDELRKTYEGRATLDISEALKAFEIYQQRYEKLKQTTGLMPIIEDQEATGTQHAPGGLTLVNDGAPVNGSPAELIVDKGNAYIANGGLPTVVDLNPGAKVYNARETSQILSRGVVAMGRGGVVSVSGGHQYSSLGSYKGYSGFSGAMSSTSYGDTFNISSVTLENVNDVEGLFSGLKNLALQRSMKR